MKNLLSFLFVITLISCEKEDDQAYFYATSVLIASDADSVSVFQIERNGQSVFDKTLPGGGINFEFTELTEKDRLGVRFMTLDSTASCNISLLDRDEQIMQEGVLDQQSFWSMVDGDSLYYYSWTTEFIL